MWQVRAARLGATGRSRRLSPSVAPSPRREHKLSEQRVDQHHDPADTPVRVGWPVLGFG